jgi:uncharacterized C2H2 Zn-finger protein
VDARDNREAKDGGNDVPAVLCHLCGAPIRIFKPVEKLGAEFELSCPKCGHVFEYEQDEILTAEALNGLVARNERSSKSETNSEETMTDFYTDEGCLVVISVPRVGATFPLQRAYAVAEKDHRTARHMMEKALPDDEPILAITTLPAEVMRELKLRPGEHISWPEVRR